MICDLPRCLYINFLSQKFYLQYKYNIKTSSDFPICLYINLYCKNSIYYINTTLLAGAVEYTNCTLGEG